MTDKPKKWTWEEWLSKTAEDMAYDRSELKERLCAYWGGEAFHANEPYIEWLEQTILKQHEALAFYAKEENYLRIPMQGFVQTKRSTKLCLNWDGNKLARQTLEKTKDVVEDIKK